MSPALHELEFKQGVSSYGRTDHWIALRGVIEKEEMKMINKVKSIAGVATALVVSTLSGCYVSGYDYYYSAWYDVYGNVCTYGQPYPGCNYYYTGGRIVAGDDPYYSSSQLYYGTYFLNGTVFTGYAWQSPTGIVYDAYGRALNSNSSSVSRDILARAADQEQVKVEEAGERFAAKYHLSLEAGTRVAQALNDWATLPKTRARTQKDLQDFTQRLYGIDFNRILSAIEDSKRGQENALNSAIADAAQNWGTNPENMREIMAQWFGKELRK